MRFNMLLSAHMHLLLYRVQRWIQDYLKEVRYSRKLMENTQRSVVKKFETLACLTIISNMRYLIFFKDKKVRTLCPILDPPLKLVMS